jgi:hypothetical protein
MGFSNYSKSNQENRKLQNGIRSGFFTKFSSGKFNLSTSRKTSLEKSSLEKANKQRRLAVLKSLIYLMTLTVFLTPVLLKLLERQLIQYSRNYKKSIIDYQVPRAKEQNREITQDHIQSYNHYVDIGKQHFDKGNIDAAIENFYYAREYFDYGKDANIGLAISYSFSCTTHLTNCNLAGRDYNVARKSPTLTFEDLVLLENNKIPDNFHL